MNQKQVNQFFKAVRALDRLHGGTGDNSLSGLQRAVDLSHARESAREATVKLGRAAFGGWEHTFESRPEYKAAAEEGVQEGLTILAKRKAAEEKAKADFQKDVEEAAYFSHRLSAKKSSANSSQKARRVFRQKAAPAIKRALSQKRNASTSSNNSGAKRHEPRYVQHRF